MAEFRDLQQVFGEGAQLVTLRLIYFRPDHHWLLQDFIWQTLDVVPVLPRIHHFLDHWQREIEATIHSIELAAMHPSGRPVILSPGFVGLVH